MQLLSLLAVTSFVLPAILANDRDTNCGNNPSLSRDVKAFLDVKFDYLVVGGGTAGMAVAARIAESTTSTVGIIEAGHFLLNDSLVNTPALNQEMLGNTTYDWNFISVPQTNAGLRNVSLPRGKMLGGSSGTNMMAFNRASSSEYDAWQTFASLNGWNWHGMLPYFAKSQHIASSPTNPFPGYVAKNGTFDNSAADCAPAKNSNGPIAASFDDFYFSTVPSFVQTVNAMGIKVNADPLSGNATGVYNSLLSVDRSNGVRSYSPIGYLCSLPARSNLHILTGAQATKIQLSESHSEVVATGVQFSVGNQLYAVKASKEVILSAGTVKTPQLLELSGIGNSTLLSSHGISTLVNLPGVGENFQEHLNVGVQWELKAGVATFDILRNNATFAAEQQALYDKNRTGLLTELDSTLTYLPLQAVTSEDRIKSLLAIFDEQAALVDSSSLQAKQFKIQRGWVEEGTIAQVELILWSKGIVNPAPNASYILVLGGITHPTSRGSVHISSNDPLSPPDVDAGYLGQEYDAQVLLDTLKLLLKIGKTSPLSDIIEEQTTPDPTIQDDEDLLSYVRNSCAGSDHLIGTAAMAPRSLGGVVDSSLKVYGTQNLRVVDASIIPLHVSAHTSSTVYAIAEKAVEMILADSHARLY